MSYAVPKSIEGRPFVIIGAGTLGRRIAAMWMTGENSLVHIFDSSAQQLTNAQKWCDENMGDILKDVVPGAKKGTLKTFTDREAAVKNAWIVVEAVPEIKDLKIKLLGELDAIIPRDCILASNSSSYPSGELIEKVTHKDRVVTTHYYMPPHANAVEVMPNEHTHPDIVQYLVNVAPAHGLDPFNVRHESVGLIFNRVWAAIKREALYVVASGVSTPSEVDRLMMSVQGTARGVFQMIDEVGLDVALAIEEHYAATRAEGIPKEPRELLKKYIAEGKLGQKSGEGFYKYEAPGSKVMVK